MMMFGPSDAESSNTEQSMKWKIKNFTNDELRQKFLNATLPQAKHIGIEIPDPDLRFDEATGNWIHGEIDWSEFWSVVRGDGPCNRERLAARRDASAEGAWVREAMMAYAEKQQMRSAEAA